MYGPQISESSSNIEKIQGNRGYSITASVNALSRFYEWLSQDYPDEMNPVDRHTAVTSYSGSKTAREEEGYKTGVADEDYRLLLDKSGPGMQSETDC